MEFVGHLINISGYSLHCGHLWGCNFVGITARINVSMIPNVNTKIIKININY